MTTKAYTPKGNDTLKWAETKAPSGDYHELVNTLQHEVFEFDAIRQNPDSTHGFYEVVAWIMGPLDDSSWIVVIGSKQVPVPSQDAAVLYVELMC